MVRAAYQFELRNTNSHLIPLHIKKTVVLPHYTMTLALFIFHPILVVELLLPTLYILFLKSPELSLYGIKLALGSLQVHANISPNTLILLVLRVHIVEGCKPIVGPVENLLDFRNERGSLTHYELVDGHMYLLSHHEEWRLLRLEREVSLQAVENSLFRALAYTVLVFSNLMWLAPMLPSIFFASS